MASDEREIRTMHSIWIDAVNAGDLARLLTLVAEDVVFLTPGQAPFGREGFSSNFMAAHPADADLLHQRVGRGRCCQRGRLRAEPRRTVSDPARRREGGTVRRTSHDGISQAARRSLASVPRCPHFVRRGLTPRWSQRRPSKMASSQHVYEVPSRQRSSRSRSDFRCAAIRSAVV